MDVATSYPKGPQRLQDVVAHGSNVTCLSFGHKSGHVLVTGGNDNKVNLWAVGFGKSNCIMSLGGHVTSIQCVRFGPTENTVCAGSIVGAVKAWDLEVARLMRTLTGHKDAIKALEFHPYGDLLTSGSKDTNIKLWDIRQKGCIFTYPGHTETVNSLKFSPDGQWIASGGNEGVIKLWDIRTGRMIQEFIGHKGPITSVEFHPHDFLLASSSQDSTVNFWNLENFKLEVTVGKEQISPYSVSYPRCLQFNSAGDAVYVAGQDGVRVFGWEPARTISTMSVQWGKVRDIALSSSGTSLFGASFRGTSVSVWVVDTDHLMAAEIPTLEAATGESSAAKSSSSPFTSGNTLRKSFKTQKPTPEARKSLSVKTIEESERSETDPEEDILPEIPNVIDYRNVFQPTRSLNRSPPVSIYTQAPPSPAPARVVASPPPPSDPLCVESDSDPIGSSPITAHSFPYSSHAVTYRNDPHDGQSHGTVSMSSSSSYCSSELPNLVLETPSRDVEDAEPLVEFKVPASVRTHLDRPMTERRRSEAPVNAPNSTARHRRHSAVQRRTDPVDVPVQLSSVQHSSSETNVSRSLHASRVTARTHAQPSPTDRHLLRETKSDPKPRAPTSVSRSHSPDLDDFVPMTANRPTGLDFEAFIPRSYNNSILPHPQTSEAEVLSTIIGGHEGMMAIYGTRTTNLQIVHALWQNKGVKAAVEGAVRFGDSSIIVDLLGVMVLRPDVWNLDVCVSLLPCILDLLKSKYETYMRAGCEALRIILRDFSEVIRNNVLTGSSAIGVDISKEERYRKCIKCYNNLVSIRAFLLKRQTLQGPLGQNFRELAVAIQEIDT